MQRDNNSQDTLELTLPNIKTQKKATAGLPWWSSG